MLLSHPLSCGWGETDAAELRSACSGAHAVGLENAGEP